MSQQEQCLGREEGYYEKNLRVNMEALLERGNAENNDIWKKQVLYHVATIRAGQVRSQLRDVVTLAEGLTLSDLLPSLEPVFQGEDHASVIDEGARHAARTFLEANPEAVFVQRILDEGADAPLLAHQFLTNFMTYEPERTGFPALTPLQSS